jgi:hypothetical protein
MRIRIESKNFVIIHVHLTLTAVSTGRIDMIAQYGTGEVVPVLN